MSGKIFYGALETETNSFSNIPTNIASFEETGILRGRECLYDRSGAPRAALLPVFEFANQRKLELIGGICASAWPSAPIQQKDYEALRDEMLERLRAAMPVASVVLNLHGAMMATECWDCEGDLLKRLRALVGSAVPIGVVLDPHAHLSAEMVDSASILAFIKEYPHTDGVERMADVLRVIGGMLDGEVRPKPAVADCRLIGFFPTQSQPMRGFVDTLFSHEKRPGVLSVSFVHGFPWGDTPETGAKALVYTNGDAPLAAAIAKGISEDIWRIKDRTAPETITISEAMALALQPRTKPLILADISDNPGGGAPSDSTFLLSACLDAGLSNVTIGLIFDPELVRTCHQIGVGGRFEARIGGKLGRSSGAPVDLEVEVRGLARSARMDVLGQAEFSMGDTAWIHGAGVDIVLSSIRIQMYAPSGFAHLGLDPATRSVLIVKSSNHFRAAFAPIAGEIAVVSTPGAMNFNYAELPYRRLVRPVFPRVADPFRG